VPDPRPAGEPAPDAGFPPIEDAPPVAYVAALVVYVALGYLLGSVVLNWIVGPLFLLLVLHLVPKAWPARSRRP